MNDSIPISPSTISPSPNPADQPPILSMVIVIGIKFLLAICTILTSSSLILVTFKSRNLHGTCNLLLAANALCICLYSFTFLNQFAAFLLAGPNGISVRLCCLLQSVPIIGNYGQYVFFALVALDRLTSVLLPIWSRGLHLSIQRHQNAYIFVLFGLGFGYGLGACISSIFQAFGNPDRFVVCETGTSTPQFLSNVGMVLSISSAFFYLGLLLAFKLRQWKFAATMSSPVRRDNEYTRRLLRSLMAMFLMEFFGWSSNQIATKILNALGYDSLQRWFIKSFVGYLTQTTLLLYAPILYIFSSEYRLGFSKTFGLEKANGIAPSTAIVQQNVPANYSSAYFRNYQQNQQQRNSQQIEVNNVKDTTL